MSNEFLVSRIQALDEGGSGRNIIYSNLWNNWLESNSLVNYLFGFGFASTIKYSGVGLLAHNDWLELLTNFGLLGVFIYLLIFGSAIGYVFNLKVDKEYRIMMFAIVVMWFSQTLFSMYYTASTTVFPSIILGYLFGINQRNTNLR